MLSKPSPIWGLLATLLVGADAIASAEPAPGSGAPKFAQLEQELPTPNVYRTGSGAPGHAYWQQRADYVIEVTLDDERQRITGSELVTYHNRSPDTLRYLWLQLDANIYAADADGALAQPAPDFEKFPYDTLGSLLALEQFEGGITIGAVRDGAGRPLPYSVVKTMMRIDLAESLEPGERTSFSVDWSYNINDAVTIGGRSGYERFEADGNFIYEIAQFYPRVAAYTDFGGWQHKQFLGKGEFTLELGDYLVRINVPADHVVAATGELANPREVLTARQRDRLEEARSSAQPVFIVTPREASRAESARSEGRKTWVFEAENVRDFAFASSRKFIWDAWGRPLGDRSVMAMSFYPNEAEPLWSRYSTHAIAHTIEVYSRYTFEYPYPVAISVNGPVGGMEYPMISFNAPRPYEDGTYWDRKPPDDESIEWKHTKYGLISVIIHEVGHNYFPMVINSDERQWTWMDEGLNTFLQFIAEQEWEDDYPSRRGEPQDLVTYMRSEARVPVMTNSESLLQFGNNAYAKPATALNILRESILGRELFDYAFREYARRWKFKRPTPADFFRTMEDASGVDLDWFWRGWFYSAEPVDIAIENVRLYELDSRDPAVEKEQLREDEAEQPQTLSQRRYADVRKRVDLYPELKDFYNTFDPFEVLPSDSEAYRELIDSLEATEAALLATDRNFYVVDLRNVGGTVMPVILDVEYVDGEREEIRLPAEIWRLDATAVSKLLMTEREIASITLDPHLETADINTENNHWPRQPIRSRFQLFKEQLKEANPMQEKASAEAGQDDG